jgi:4'-phosphopantetheinyl transferase
VLAQDEVHVWRASLEVPSSYVALIGEILSSDERAKADRFVFEKHCQNFVVSHGFLRAILSRYLDCAPDELQFGCAEHGKPFLVGHHTRANLSFNLSHSGSVAIYGITRGRAIGVDLERIRPKIDIAEIARQFFSTSESSCLLSISSDARVNAFFDCWTRKEAFIKAKGAGLSLPLDQFDVTLSPGEPARLLETRWDKNESLRWSLRVIDVATGYAAAFAVEGHDLAVKHWQGSIDMIANITRRYR